jgi:predicted nucleic-acid-binding protein
MITETVVLETEWVLRYAYGFSPKEINGAIRRLIALSNVRLSDAPRVSLALDWHERGLEFADAMHLAGCQTVDVLMTFDKQLISRAAGLGRCQVFEPPL